MDKNEIITAIIIGLSISASFMAGLYVPDIIEEQNPVLGTATFEDQLEYQYRSGLSDGYIVAMVMSENNETLREKFSSSPDMILANAEKYGVLL